MSSIDCSRRGAAGGVEGLRSGGGGNSARRSRSASLSQTPEAYTCVVDYSRPLHVDCSVEYELPNAAKPPANARTEPLLMIHPCYYRRAESQRRSPFINNLPATRQRVPQTQYPVRYPKRDPMLCGTAEFSGDSGVSGVGHWTDTGSPLAQETRLHAGPDSGIVADKSGLTALSGVEDEVGYSHFGNKNTFLVKAWIRIDPEFSGSVNWPDAQSVVLLPLPADNDISVFCVFTFRWHSL
ncbi:hypothetical protein J6590_015100 [Homalodisca vitripennis]|nr:hypothetical protein J6590_015100 [Homalodisca vitripennis]